MSEPVQSATTRAEATTPALEDARAAVISFLEKMPDVRQVNVTKLAKLDAEKGTWEAEAEAYVPNSLIKALGLPTQKEVLDCRPYLLRVDNQLNIIAYGRRDLVRK